jgi:5-methylcytosine-specific restriction endonuclease McrBC regulatory subunit McrC
MILQHLGGEPNPDFWEKKKGTVEIPPYAINMNALFERYCEAKLRKRELSEKIGKIGKFWISEENLGKKNLDECLVRPDFLLTLVDDNYKYVIADAKYKYNWHEKYKKEYRDD